MSSAVAEKRTTTRAEPALDAPEHAPEPDPRDLWLAHQLKNPLSAVKALVQLGLRNPAERAAHERLAALEREIARVEEILARHLSAASLRSAPTLHGSTLRPPGGRSQPLDR